MEKTQNVQRPLGKMLLYNFLGGIAWGMGATVGIATLITALGFLTNFINLVPIVGGFASDVTRFVLQNLEASPVLR